MHIDPFAATGLLAQYAALAGGTRTHTNKTKLPKLTSEHDRTAMAKASAEARGAARRLKVQVPTTGHVGPWTGTRGGGR